MTEAGSGEDTAAAVCPMLPMFKDAIRRIKVQKQRPGFDRLLQTLKTHQNVADARAVREQLDAAVRAGLLLTVYTKGLQCYKDPDSLQGLRKFVVTSMADVRRAVKAGVREIGDPEGSPTEVIENYVRLSFDVRTNTLDEQIQTALAQLTRKGVLITPLPNRYKFICSTAGRGAASHNDGDPNDQTTHSLSNDAPDTPPQPSPAPSVPKKRRGRPRRVVLPETVPVAEPVVAATEKPKSAPRQYKTFQCWQCHFYTPKKDLWLGHVRSAEHQARVAGKMVQCNTCHFRSRDADKVVAHLEKHGCHVKQSIPAVLLSCSKYSDLITKDK